MTDVVGLQLVIRADHEVAGPPAFGRASLAWRVVMTSELRGALVDDRGEPRDALRDAVRFELAGRRQGPAWRAQIDVEGTLCGLAVVPDTHTLHIGAPNFAAERLRCTLDAASDELRAHTAAFEAARAEDRPLAIEQVTHAHNLTALWHAAPGTELAEVSALTDTLARDVAGRIASYRAPLLERLSQLGLGLQADYAVLRVHALRFVALLPSLDHDDAGTEVQRLLAEMMRRTAQDSERARTARKTGEKGPLPGWLQGLFALGEHAALALPARPVARLTRWAVRFVAGTFIAGESIEQASDTLDALHASGRTATLDQLGELVISEPEADHYCARVLELVQGSAARHAGQRNGAGIPVGHVSVKVSALCAHYDPDDPDGTWANVHPRLVRIFNTARAGGVFVNLDAEHYAVRDLTFEMLQRTLRSDPELWRWPDVGIVVQAYLVDAADHLSDVLALGRERGVRMPIRLVKGAYFDEETTAARANGWDAPQFLNKAETDACFQQLSIAIIKAADAAQLCIGSHNLRDHCFARAARAVLAPDAPEIEHQTLHRTYEALSTAMAASGWAVRNYIPVGSLLVGMAYLVRRVMENSSQVGVLTMARRGVDLVAVLAPPSTALAGLRDDRTLRGPPDDDPLTFRNVAPARLYLPAHRRALQAAIDAREVAPSTATDSRFCSGKPALSRSPSDGRLVGTVQMACADDVPVAVAAAKGETAGWGRWPVSQRAARLVVAAELLRARRMAFAALVGKEAGKSRGEALGDVDEAVDFLNFYAREAVRREQGNRDRSPRGVIAVIAPWNFPLAIPTGMTAAALAAGNCAILKSAEQTPLVAEALVALLHEAGVPEHAVIHLPGDGPEVGAPLTAHPDIAGCVFTGSKSVGTILYRQLAARCGPTGMADDGALVITEMGGKNAVIVTANADLDEAISGCLTGAYAHAGQKCSAASRVLVDRRVMDAFRRRFARAVADLVVGDAALPGTQINPVITAHDAERLRGDAQLAAAECADRHGEVLVDRSGEFVDFAGHKVGPSAFVLPAVACADPNSIARRELFGPVVALIGYRDIDEAVALFNGTEYALTGGVYAQSLDDIDELTARLRCGNLYVNRNNTGARVAIEPFGGFKMSGTGPKAGGRAYLDAFYRPPRRCETLVVDLIDGPARAAPWIAAPLSKDAERMDMRPLYEAATVGRFTLDHRAVRALERYTHAALVDAARLAATPTLTRAIPGQDTHDHRDIGRGPTVILAGVPTTSPHLIAHLVTAVATGSPVLVAAVGRSARPWHQLLELAWRCGLSRTRVQLLADPSRADVVAALSRPDVATIACDGPRHAWAHVIDAARVHTAEQLPAIYDAGSLADDASFEAYWGRHTVVRTVAVNTMRHGAPLTVE